MPTVYLLTTGDGSDGNEWHVEAICATPEAWERAKAEYQKPVVRGDGSTYIRYPNEMETWDVQQ